MRPWTRELPPYLTGSDDLFKDETCTCGKYNYLQNILSKDEHLKDFENWKRDNYYDIIKPKPVVTGSFLPVEFISSGYKVDPNESVSLKIRIDGEDHIKIVCTFTCLYGDVIPSDSFYDTSSEESAPIQSKNIETTIGNFNSAKIKYVPNTYDARKLEDIVHLKITGATMEFEISFPVTIHRSKIPVLIYRPSSDIVKRVTVVTKTFLR